MGQLFIVLSVFCTGLTPFFSRELATYGLDPMATTALRGIVGALALGIVHRKGVLRIRRNPWASAIMVIAWALGGTSYIYAARHAPAGLNICILYLAPLWIALFEWRKLRGDWRKILAVLVGFIGILFLAQEFHSDQKAEWRGILAAVVVSFTFTTFVLASRWGERTGVTSDVAAFWALVLMTAVFAPSLPSLAQVEWDLKSASLALSFGLVTGAIYMGLYSLGARRLSASDIGVYSYAEIPFVWVLAIWRYDEQISLLGIVGTLCILVSGVLNREKSPPPE